LHSRHAEAERRSSSELKDHDRIVNMQLADGLHDLLMLQLTLVPILIQVWCISSYASKKPPAYSTYTAGPDEESHQASICGTICRTSTAYRRKQRRASRTASGVHKITGS
jgi:hypothetical protein